MRDFDRRQESMAWPILAVHWKRPMRILSLEKLPWRLAHNHRIWTFVAKPLLKLRCPITAPVRTYDFHCHSTTRLTCASSRVGRTVPRLHNRSSVCAIRLNMTANRVTGFHSLFEQLGWNLLNNVDITFSSPLSVEHFENITDVELPALTTMRRPNTTV
jgi:hypothetical protein